MMMSKSKKHPTTATAKHAAWGISRRALMVGLAGAAGAGALGWSLLGSSEPADAQTITVWKSSTCGCCGVWVAYMRGKGYRVNVNDVNDPDSIKRSLGIPSGLYSCHTAKIGDYIVEGHVPAAAVAKLLEQQPEIKGIALPGMPSGSPGMDGPPGVYRVIGFSADGSTRRFIDARG
jgi:hypothetical protein